MYSATCNGFLFLTLQDKLQNALCNPSLLCAIIASPKKLRDQLQREHVTRCNLPANYLAMAGKIASCNTSLRATFRSAIFCACVCEIKDTDDVFAHL